MENTMNKNNEAMDQTVMTCLHCGQIIENPENAYDAGDGSYVCQDCIDGGAYFICDDCGKAHPVEAGVPAYRGDSDELEKLVCETCSDKYTWCDHCGRLIADNRLHRNDHGQCICYECFDYHGYEACESCGRFATDHTWDDSREAYYCDDCLPEDGGDLHEYCYKPEPVFHKVDGENDPELFFGVELEVDKGNNRGALIRNLLTCSHPYYMKEDGSLTYDGVEIVTHPCSLRYHLETPMWDDVKTSCRAFGYTSHEARTCGLHVHVNRDGITRVAAGRLAVIVDAIWDDLVVFTRRTESQLDDWSKRPHIPAGELSDDRLLETITSYNDGRYYAVNYRNCPTVEFRVFRGSLNPATIRASIQLVANLCQYAETHSTEECRNVTLAEIVNVNPTDTLVTYCNSRNLLSANPT